MPDQTPQWPFMPAIQGQVPLPRPDPRQDKSIAFARALMAGKPSVPLPTPDPRDWATRAIHAGSESDTAGAIHPDALMNARGIQPPSGHSVDKNQWDGYPGNNGMPANQFPMGMQPPPMQQDVSNGLFGVPPQHLQQMAGDVVQLPLPSGQGAVPDLLRKQGANEEAARRGGYGWSNKNIDFKLLDSLGKQGALAQPNQQIAADLPTRRYPGIGGLHQGLDMPLPSANNSDPLKGSQERFDYWRNTHDNPTPKEEKIPTSLLDLRMQMAANRPPKPPTPASGQNLPQIPTSGFEPSLSPNYFSSDNPWTNRNQQPGAPPTFWQPG